MNVFAIIVTYNGMKNNWIHQCFTSLLSSSTTVEIIAVDNHSSDESVQYIKQHFPSVILIESSENLGFGGANNIGLQKALELGGEFFFLLNQDASVEKNTLEKLINTSLKHQEYAVISPIHLNGDGTKLDKSFAKSVSPYYCDGFYDDYVLNNTKKSIYESPFICAAAWLLTKEALKTIGGFSPAFFHYGEDDNYCHRVQYFKMKMGVVPDTYIYHDREDRPASIFDEEIVSLQRQYAVWCSNPNKPTDIDRLIGQFKNKALKYSLLRNQKEVKNSREILKFLQNRKHSIKTAFKDSISDKTYKFIG